MPTPKLEQADNGFYYVYWTNGRRSKRISTRTKDLADAKRFLGTWLLMEESNPEDVSLTCREVWDAYDRGHIQKKIQRRSPKSAKTIGYIWNNLDKHFGELEVRAVNQAVVDSYQRKRMLGLLGQKSAEGTVRREMQQLKASWAWAVKHKLIATAQVQYFDMPEPSPRRERWLSIEEVQKLLKAAESFRVKGRLTRGERFLWIAIEAAQRKTAIAELRWSQVDFGTGQMHFNPPGRVQTKKRRPSVPMSKALRPVLERAFRERENDLVLDNTSEIWETIQRIAKRAEIEDVHPHLLRHTAATHMARRGVPLYHIAGVLGITMAMCEKVYAKHAPEGLREAVDAISAGALSLIEAPKETFLEAAE